MKADNIIQDKSYKFSLEIIKLNLYMVNELKEYTLSKQILRSGTSIGANVEEAIGGISRKDFRSKISIACKESRETHYWLRLLSDSEIIPKEMGSKLKKRLRRNKKSSSIYN